MAIEARRGCGFRRVGGLYLVSEGLGEPCHRLPHGLDVCPTCHGGIKPSRGWTWIGTALFGPACDTSDGFAGTAPEHGTVEHCTRCVVCAPGLVDGARLGLLWVGEKFYKTPDDFQTEAARQGVSRRISALPKGFEAGKTLVALAHRLAIPGQGCKHSNPLGTITAEFPPGECLHGCSNNRPSAPGIFRVFRPERVELIVRKSELTEERIANEQKRGVALVAVPDGDPDHDPGGPAQQTSFEGLEPSAEVQP